MKKLSSLVLFALLCCAIAKADNGTNTPVKPYPLDHCIVCGMLVKGRTDAFTFVYHGQEIKLCDKSEKEEFDRAPEKYLNKIRRAAAQQTNSVSQSTNQ
jgi:YHS domain-containing protein